MKTGPVFSFADLPIGAVAVFHLKPAWTSFGSRWPVFDTIDGQDNGPVNHNLAGGDLVVLVDRDDDSLSHFRLQVLSRQGLHWAFCMKNATDTYAWFETLP